MSASDELRFTSAPRTLSDEERRLLRLWTTAASDEVSAYVIQRRSDDPAMVGRIVVIKGDTRKPLYSLHRPVGLGWWIVSSLVEPAEIGTFATLRDGLNFIRPVLPT
jgi:hypothetical protein